MGRTSPVITPEDLKGEKRKLKTLENARTIVEEMKATLDSMAPEKNPRMKKTANFRHCLLFMDKVLDFQRNVVDYMKGNLGKQGAPRPKALRGDSRGKESKLGKTRQK